MFETYSFQRESMFLLRLKRKFSKKIEKYFQNTSMLVSE